MNLHPDQFGEQLELFDPGPKDPKLPEEQQEFLLNDVRAANSPTAIRADAAAARSILQENRFRTQHDPNTGSNGHYGPAERLEAENILFGKLGKTREHHPTYGYQDTPDMESDVHQYGDVKFTLKPHVREHTTMTRGDSLVFGTPDFVPSRLGDIPWAYQRSRDRGYPKPSYVTGQDYDQHKYYEAQIHKPVIPTRDVDKVSIDTQWAELDPEHVDVLRAAESRNIPWSASVEKKMVQPTLIPQDTSNVVNKETGSVESHDWRQQNWGPTTQIYEPLDTGGYKPTGKFDHLAAIRKYLGFERVPVRRDDIPFF